MHNIEYKAELRDMALAQAACKAVGAKFVITLEQTDTYFRVPSGRLKRRVCQGEPTEWIFYDRTNKSRPRLSSFTIYSSDEARARFGATPLPVQVVVKKSRELYMLDNVRIHLDTVEQLGTFLEFEALVSPGYPVAACHARIDTLREAFSMAMGEPISCSYGDLVLQEQETTPVNPPDA